VKQFWLGEEEAPDVYRLPDPAVSYRVSITTQDGRVRVGEAEFSAIPEDQNNERKSLYLAQAIGSRFEKPTLTPPERLPASGPHTHYELTASLKARDGGTKRPPQPKPPVYLVAGLSIVPAPKDFTVDPVNMAHWGRVAPAIEVGLLSFVITPPDADKPQLPPSFPQFPPDSRWPAFKVAMAQYVAALQGYVSGPGPQRVIDSAAAILAEVSKFVVGSVGAWPGPKSDDGSRALPATLYLPWLLGLPASADHVSVIPLGAWVWPRDLGRDAGLAEFRAKIAGVLGAAGASAELQAAVAIALRAYAVAWMVYGVAQRRFEDETPWHGQSVIRRSAPGPIDTAALRASAADPFDFVASVELAQDALRQQEQVEAAFTSLEQQKHSAEALEGLAALWFEPGRSVRIQLRWAEHVAIKAVLRLLPGGGAITPVVSAVLLRMPALKSETASLAPANQALPELLEAMTMEMLFGPGRRLLIQAFHGLAVPEEDHVERVEP